MRIPLAFLQLILALCYFSCMQAPPQSNTSKPSLDIQGHRGCRGLMPENTVLAFLKAVEIGVHTLELDVVISQDQQVVVSHEPFFNHEISQKPDGTDITEEEERNHNMYQMSYDQIRRYDVGQRVHPRFPDQAKLASSKPLLSEIIVEAESYARSLGRPPLRYNIETKSTPAGDGLFHPDPETFVDLVMKVVLEKGIEKRTTIQSFDPRTLKVMHQKYPNVALVLLVENQDGLQANLDRLGFTPQVYSPYFKFVDAALLKAVHDQQMKLIPWTINEKEDIQAMIKLGVDGIISDYPDRVVEILQ